MVLEITITARVAVARKYLLAELFAHPKMDSGQGQLAMKIQIVIRQKAFGVKVEASTQVVFVPSALRNAPMDVMLYLIRWET